MNTWQQPLLTIFSRWHAVMWQEWPPTPLPVLFLADRANTIPIASQSKAQSATYQTDLGENTEGEIMATHIVHDVLVIGGGVSGLTTALALADRKTYDGHKFNVKVFAEHYADEYNPGNPTTTRLVSTIAGALWEFPPAVCGMHGNQLSVARSEKWCMTAYARFAELAEKHPESGVSMRWAYFYFNEDINGDRVERLKRAKLKDLSDNAHIKEFKDLSATEIKTADTALGGGGKHVKAGYKLIVPVIETPVYMPWLLNEVQSRNNVTIIRPGDELSSPSHVAPLRITDRLAPQEETLRELFDVDALVNCTALGAAELAGDSMVPLRGALVAVPRKKFADETGPEDAIAMAKTKFRQDMIFIVPRKEEVIIGGFAEPSEYRTDLTKDYKQVAAMFERSKKFLKSTKYNLENVKLDDSALRLDVGLRPYRAQNVCVEREYGCNIVHNYGHTGAGFTFSYGCAEEVVDLVESMEGTAFHTRY